MTLAVTTIDGPIVTPDDRLTTEAVDFFNGRLMQNIANNVAQSDITVRVGTPTVGSDGRTSVVPGAERCLHDLADRAAQTRSGP